MANINLISSRRAERVRLARIARGLAVATIVVLTMGMGSAGFMFGQIIMAGGSLAKAEAQMEKLRPVLDEIAASEQRQAQLKPKLETLTQAQVRTHRWWSVMEGFKRAIPNETWLTNMAVEKNGDDDQTVRINGITANQARVGETMYRLSQQQEFYKKVDLRFTQVSQDPLDPKVEFELAAQMNPVEGEEKPADDESGGKGDAK